MGEFDAYSETYRESVQRSINFVGQEHDYFARRKADLLLDFSARHLGEPAQLSFLDVGCGVGVTDAALADRVGALHGVDVAAEAVARAAEQNPTVAYRSYDGDSLPYDDHFVDIAFAIYVTHHITYNERNHFATKLHRVVRVGGLVAIFEHNPFNPLTRVAVSRCDFDFGVELLSRKAVERLLRDAGLVPIESRYIIFTTSERPRVVAFEKALRGVPLGAQHYVVARRVS